MAAQIGGAWMVGTGHQSTLPSNPASATVRPSPSTAYSSMGRNPSWPARPHERVVDVVGRLGPTCGDVRWVADDDLLAGIELFRQVSVGEHGALGGGEAAQQVVERMDAHIGAIR